MVIFVVCGGVRYSWFIEVRSGMLGNVNYTLLNRFQPD